GRAAAAPEAAPATGAPADSGTHRLTEYRRPLTSTSTSRLTLASGPSSADAGVGAESTPVRSRTSSTHLVEWVAAAKSGCSRIATSAGIVVAKPSMRN